MNKITDKIETDLQVEYALTAVRGEESWGHWVKKMHGLSKKTLTDTDNGVVITRGKGG